jgi:hypothetical protein
VADKTAQEVVLAVRIANLHAREMELVGKLKSITAQLKSDLAETRRQIGETVRERERIMACGWGREEDQGDGKG